jgi:peptide-methionine (S)-S-oxide reductase
MPWWSPRVLLRRFGDPRRTEVATFAAGCFRGVEAEFRELDGVTDTAAGYTRGFTPDPSYEEVRAGQTGHAGAGRVIFAPAAMSCRSAVFAHSSEQTRLVLDSTAKEQRLRTTPIATEVVPPGPFYLAEPYHQGLYEREGGSAPRRYALSDLKSWLALTDPDDPSARNGVTHEPGHSRWRWQ